MQFSIDSKSILSVAINLTTRRIIFRESSLLTTTRTTTTHSKDRLCDSKEKERRKRNIKTQENTLSKTNI